MELPIYFPLILGEIKKRIEEVEAELNEKRLKSAVKNFREKQNEKWCKEYAARDLEITSGVEDKSVMKYHKGKIFRLEPLTVPYLP